MKAVVSYSDSFGEKHVDLVGDSAIVRCKDPFFVPDRREWKVMPLGGVVIDRLGKGIDRKFAGRYYTKCITAAHPFASDDKDRGMTRWGRDGALVISLQDDSSMMSDELKSRIDAEIESISRIATLKTGDLILVGTEESSFPIQNASSNYDVEYQSGLPPLRLKVR